ncbi:MAG TPA: sulfite exporter TauE/SafE family protein [Deltaproteobacteria bacterium]|nr:sulfite exporter TauE/SafE family protein [Deltaproteobacteria bacterium]
MEYVIVCVTALVVSGVTLFSGFGLGTVLMPAFAIFFPVPIAIAATAVVHLLNNVFKIILVGRNADWDVIKIFAVPGAFAAIVGALVLHRFAQSPSLYIYQIGDQVHSVTTIKLVIGLLIVVFACFELIPRLSNVAFDRKYLFHGGLLSGFFGGLSGNQGALRSVFLIKAGLDKDAYVGTGTVSAVIVDVSRLFVYGITFYTGTIVEVGTIGGVVVAATSAAFIGSFIGAKLLKKITLRAVQIIVGSMLIVAGTGMAAGLV